MWISDFHWPWIRRYYSRASIAQASAGVTFRWSGAGYRRPRNDTEHTRFNHKNSGSLRKRSNAFFEKTVAFDFEKRPNATRLRRSREPRSLRGCVCFFFTTPLICTLQPSPMHRLLKYYSLIWAVVKLIIPSTTHTSFVMTGRSTN